VLYDSGSRYDVFDTAALVTGSGRTFIFLCEDSRPGLGPTLAPTHWIIGTVLGVKAVVE